MTPTPLPTNPVSWVAIFWFCLAAWISGALFGFGLPETLKSFSAPRLFRVPRRSKKKHSYYFSEDKASFSNPRWRRWLGWTSAAAVVLVSAVAIAITVGNFGLKHHGPKIAGVVSTQ